MLGQGAERHLDGRWVSVSAERNKGPILEILKRILPSKSLVLEIGSGTGQHVVHFASALPALTWQPSDPDGEFRESISLWATAEKLSNVNVPVDLDVCRHPWPVPNVDAVLSINMVHIAPWAATEALLAGASDVLSDGGVLYLYGPYRRFGRHTAPSNEAFDAQLRGRNPDWGLRDMEEVVRLAEDAGFEHGETINMPANNFSLVFRKGTATRK
ncbi:MAG: DUF938 domain-containing protein [Gammaproteobacteria bacterium]|nr:DUF938 domain-containing protein [Gammaproteobacteria bacterium]